MVKIPKMMYISSKKVSTLKVATSFPLSQYVIKNNFLQFIIFIFLVLLILQSL